MRGSRPFGRLVLGMLFFTTVEASLCEAQPAPLAARVKIATEAPGPALDGRLWGSNLLNTSPRAETVDNPDFVAAARRMGIRVIRWPGGNQGDIYDWKRNEQVLPGRRVPLADAVTLLDAARFCEAIGAELSITVNFGTMNAADAADLVEFCNGPVSSTWGAQRAQAGHPEPLNVRFWEIGNEENQPHMWHFSWTAENPRKYFFGGEEERRGTYPPSRHDPYGLKGDSFGAEGGPNQTYRLRFPPVRDVRVLVAPNRAAAEARQFRKWREVPAFSTEAADAEVFTLEPDTGTVRFGDGVHGAMPAADAVLLVEYTTHGHDGYVAFARAMRQAPSSVPLQIGAATLPFVDGQPLDIPTTEMQALLDQMDFHVNHRYNAGFDYSTYAHRRQIAWERTQPGVHGRFADYVRSLGRDRVPDIAVTEWNIFLDERIWQLNLTLEGAVIAAEYFIRLLNAGPEVPVTLAEQFALHGGALSLYHTQFHHTISPMGSVFEGFASWRQAHPLAVTVESPTALAFDQDLPYLQAAAALSPNGASLLVALSNNAENTTLTVRIETAPAGLPSVPGLIRRLEGPSPEAWNPAPPERIALHDAPISPATDGTLTVPLAAHSVAFLDLPLADRPRFTDIQRTADGRIEVRWILPPGASYRLEESTDLQTWTTLIEDLIPYEGHWTLSPDPAPGPHWLRIAQ